MRSHPPLNNTRLRTLRSRRAMTLLELVVSMGLLALIMVPVVSLLGTSYKVMNRGSDQAEGSYARHVGLDAAAMLLSDSQNIIDSSTTHVTVGLSSGLQGRLSFSRGELLWQINGGSPQLLARGLSGARFSVGTAAGATAVAGQLLKLELATRTTSDLSDQWSSTELWIRPTI